MSNHHAKRKHHAKPKPVIPKDRLLLIIAATMTAMILALTAFAFIARIPFGHHRSNRPWPSVSAQVLQTRVITVGAEDIGFHGGSILYRAEAFVSYDRNGREERRWLPASSIKSNKASLTLGLSQKKSKRCIVHWNPNNPSDIEAVLH